MVRVLLALLVSMGPGLAQPQFPSFSWDTLPVAWHSALMRKNMTQQEFQMLARYATVTFEKTQGSLAFPWQRGGHAQVKHAEETCQNGTDLSKCGCCEEDKIVSAATTLKALNPKVHVFGYTNSIIAYPWYRGAHNLTDHPELWLRDWQGNLVNNIKQDPTETWHTWDHSQDAARDIFASQCKQMVASGVVDGCFVDGCTSVPQRLEHNVSVAYSGKKRTMLTTLQREIPGVLICGSNGNVRKGMLGTQLQDWGKHGDYSKREIPMLQHAMAAGVMFHAHGSAVCEHRANYAHPAVQTELAAFLVAAQEHAYYMCGGWSGTVPTWYPVYDKRLGAPLSNATLVNGTYTREFSSGTKVVFDTKTEKGTISWADDILV